MKSGHEASTLWFPRKIPHSILLLAGALAAISLGQGVANALRSTGAQDFRNQYDTVRLMYHGENPYRLKLDGLLDQRAGSLLGELPGILDPDYFPSTLLPILPMALLPWEAARAVRLGVELVASLIFVVALLRLSGARRPPPRHLALWLFVFVGGTPFRNDLGLGQNAIFSLAITTMAVLTADSRHHCLAGILLALGVFKYQLVWPLVLFFFVLDRQWRCLAWAAAIHLTVHLLLCWRMSANPWIIQWEVLQGNSDVFFRDAMFTVWTPWRALDRLFPSLGLPTTSLGALTILALLAGLVWLWSRRHHASDRVGWVGMLCLLAVVTTTSKVYDLVFLPAIFLCLMGSEVGHFSTFQRWRIFGYIAYLTMAERVLGWLRANHGGPSNPWLFNLVLVLLGLEFGLGFLRGEMLFVRARSLSNP